MYADALFPCPPCPFPSQSNASLERNLVKSARLAQSWTTRPMRDISWVKIKLKGEPTTPPKLIHGRWLIACELTRRSCYTIPRLVHSASCGSKTNRRCPRGTCVRWYLWRDSVSRTCCSSRSTVRWSRQGGMSKLVFSIVSGLFLDVVFMFS